jgi:hypothetical protein
MKLRRWIIPGIGIALAIALTAPAFILVNFSSMSSQMKHDAKTVSSSVSRQPVQPIYPEKTGLMVSGDHRLTLALQNQIIKDLQSKAAFGQIQVFNSSVDRVNYPVLLVEIAPADYFWTPIYARVNLKVSVSYASDGDVSFRLTQPAFFQTTGGQPAIKRSSDYSFSDVSWGIISSPGYINYLSREIARIIEAGLKAE